MTCPHCGRGEYYVKSPDYGRGAELCCSYCGARTTTRDMSAQDAAQINDEIEQATARGREEYARSQGHASWQELVRARAGRS